MKYHVTVGEHTYEVDLSGPTPRLNGKTVEAELRPVGTGGVHHLMVGRSSRTVIVQPAGTRGSWKVGVNGRSVLVEVLDERTRAIREMTGAADVEAPKVLVAPMPGMVVRVNVEAGQAVTAGQGIVVVEAMKMENELKAPAAGTVTSIQVVAGQAVEKGAVLVKFE